MNKKDVIHLDAVTEHRKDTNSQKMRILVVTSVSIEQEAVLRGLGGDSRFTVITGGVGSAAAAASTASALATRPYDLVVSCGIAGGFVGRAEVESLVVATDIIAADLGVETADGFLPLDELGFGTTRFDTDTRWVYLLTDCLRDAGLPVTSGSVLTVSTVTGTAEAAEKLLARFPGAAAEAMEGYGVAVAAQMSGISVLEIRAISNVVGPRNREEWRIREALDALEQASSILREVLQ